MHGNCNAPRAVTLSAIIYCLRCMVGHDVPLNQVIKDIIENVSVIKLRAAGLKSIKLLQESLIS